MVSRSDYREYKEYLTSLAWIRLRNRALSRSGHTCEFIGCGSRRNLQVHHLHYYTLYHESDDDLLVTCPFHHGFYDWIRKNNLVPSYQVRDLYSEQLDYLSDQYIEFLQNTDDTHDGYVIDEGYL